MLALLVSVSCVAKPVKGSPASKDKAVKGWAKAVPQKPDDPEVRAVKKVVIVYMKASLAQHRAGLKLSKAMERASPETRRLVIKWARTLGLLIKRNPAKKLPAKPKAQSNAMPGKLLGGGSKLAPKRGVKPAPRKSKQPLPLDESF